MFASTVARKVWSSSVSVCEQPDLRSVLVQNSAAERHRHFAVRHLEQVAMQPPGTDRAEEIERRVGEIREAIEQAKAQALTLADLGTPVALPGGMDHPAIDLLGFERVLLGVKATSQYFHPHPAIEGAYCSMIPSTLPRTGCAGPTMSVNQS